MRDTYGHKTQDNGYQNRMPHRQKLPQTKETKARNQQKTYYYTHYQTPFVNEPFGLILNKILKIVKLKRKAPAKGRALKTKERKRSVPSKNYQS